MSENPVEFPVDPKAIINHILIVVAMDKEAEYIKAEMELEDRDCVNEFQLGDVGLGFYSKVSDLGRASLFVAPKDPVHKVNSLSYPLGMYLASLLDKLKDHEIGLPNLVINAGLAGGRADAQINDVYIAQGIVSQHDTEFGNDEDNKPYAEGRYPLMPIKKECIANCGAKVGSVSSGNSMVNKKSDVRKMKELGSICKEMEAVPILRALACFKSNGIQAVFIKGICDSGIDVDKDTQAKLEVNYEAVMESVAAVTKKAVDVFIGAQFKQVMPPVDSALNENHLSGFEPMNQ